MDDFYTPVVKAMRTWVINLARSEDRWQAFQQQCRAQNYTVERWEATDGKVVGLEALIKRGSVAPNADFVQLPNRAAIGGVCDSTQRLWRYLIDSPEEWHLILEDDVALPADFSRLLGDAWQTLPSDAEVVLLGCDFGERGHPMIDRWRFGYSLKHSTGPWWRVTQRVGGAFAYAVRTTALDKLLQLTPFEHAIDCWPQGLCCYLLALTTVPYYADGMAFYGVVRCTGAPSTVQESAPDEFLGAYD